MNVSGNCSIIYDSAITLVDGAIGMMDTHNWVMVVLAILGLIAILASIFSQSIKGLTIIGYVVAIPVIIGMNLINKKKRKARVDDLNKIWGHITKKHSKSDT